MSSVLRNKYCRYTILSLPITLRYPMRLIICIGILLLYSLCTLAVFDLGEVSENCARVLCPSESSLSLWEAIQPFCLPSKQKQQQQSYSSSRRRLEAIDNSISALTTGLVCAASSMCGIAFGLFLAKSQWYSNFSPSNKFGQLSNDFYITKRFQLGWN